MFSRTQIIVTIVVVGLLVYGFFVFDIPYRKDFGSLSYLDQATTTDYGVSSFGTTTMATTTESTTATTTGIINSH